MNVEDVVLPKDQQDLVRLYIYVNSKINEIWKEYVIHTNLKYIPETTKIFAIIFCEMDFYECILARIKIHLSDDDMVELRKHDALWNW